MEKDIIKIGLKAEVENIDEIEQQIKDLQDKLSNMKVTLTIKDEKGISETDEEVITPTDIENNYISRITMHDIVRNLKYINEILKNKYNYIAGTTDKTRKMIELDLKESFEKKKKDLIKDLSNFRYENAYELDPKDFYRQ